MNELQNTTSNNIGAVEQYFEINNLFINPSKTHYILFQTKQCGQESNLKILIKNREISNVKSTNFLGVVIDSTLSQELHIEKTCSRISRNLFIINRLSKILDLNERRMLYYGLIYPHLSYGITVWGHRAKTLTRRIFVLHKKGSQIHCRAKTSGIMQGQLQKSKDTNSKLAIYTRNNPICNKKNVTAQ